MYKVSKIAASMTTVLFLTGCGTLTGIPGHGGGKRFVEEQRLVSASIRSSLKRIDITPLSGKRVALIFALIADEGSGTIQGGRASISSIISAATMIAPVGTRSSMVEVYDLVSGGSSTSTTTSAGSGSSSGSTVVVGTNSDSSTSTGNGSTSSETSGSSTSEGSNSNSSSGTASGSNSSSTTTGGTTTEQTGSSDSTNSSSSSGTNSSSGSNSSSSSGTSSSSSTTDSSGTSESNQTSSGSSTSESNTQTDGSSTGNSQQVFSNGYTEQVKGEDHRVGAAINYRGLGEYRQLQAPKSDASLLMSLTRNYFLLNGSAVTTPQDPTAEVAVYITVDVFGINRQRTDLVVYNNERLRAETAIEMFAADRTGRIIMRPQVGNAQAHYREDYIFWAGPGHTSKGLKDGEGLLDDFTDQ